MKCFNAKRLLQPAKCRQKGHRNAEFPQEVRNISGLTAYDFVRNQLGYEPENICIYGQSLGGFIATYVSSMRQSQAGVLCLQSTRDQIARTGRMQNFYLRLFPDFMLPSPHMDNIALIRKNIRPLFVIHGENVQALTEIFEELN